MAKKPPDKPAVDWRKLPRKPAAQKRTAPVNIKVTADQYAKLKANAAAAGLTMVDYIVSRCCG